MINFILPIIAFAAAFIVVFMVLKARKPDKTAFKSAACIVLTTAFILLIPLLAMQITDEVVWGLADFAMAGTLLVGTGLMYELVARKTGNIAYRAAVGIMLAAAFLIVGINLAVGIIGTEDNPANLMYIGVLAVGIIGALIARFQPHGMSCVLFTTAFIQVLIAVIALIGGMGSTGPIWPWDLLLMNGFFAALFVGSALLFRKAAREQTPTDAVPAD